MTERKRAGPSATQRADLWCRWKAGQSLHEIGRALGKEYAVIHFLLARHGGIAPPAVVAVGSVAEAEAATAKVVAVAVAVVVSESVTRQRKFQILPLGLDERKPGGSICEGCGPGMRQPDGYAVCRAAMRCVIRLRTLFASSTISPFPCSSNSI